jgi:hypothetical protein
MLGFMATPGWADPVVGPFSFPPPIDTILGYESLPTASEAQELAFVSGLVGTPVQFLQKIDSGSDVKALTGYDPGFAWAYALVKVDGPNDFSYVFMDDNGSSTLAGGDDLLSTPAAGTAPYNMHLPPLGISHVTFYNTVQVAEPAATLLLLGLGVVGLAGLRRKA